MLSCIDIQTTDIYTKLYSVKVHYSIATYVCIGQYTPQSLCNQQALQITLSPSSSSSSLVGGPSPSGPALTLSPPPAWKEAAALLHRRDWDN